MTVLCIAAHPDDEVLGCGATLARLSDEGHAVHIVILGEGITARHGRREEADPKELEALRARSQAAAAILGARAPVLHDFPDNRFDTVALLDLVKCVESHVDRLAPTALYVQHGGDLNVDHRRVFEAALTATRPMVGHPVRELYAFEVPSATEWAFQRFEPPFRPTCFVDVERTLERKIAAMQTYEGEARAFPHPRSPEALRALARVRGSAAGMAAAEAFEVIRVLR
jgi:LmbE family N-acetylglucosaminyl deacetylase